MTVRYYEWGTLAGGGGGTVVVPADALYGPPEQFSGAVTNVAAIITFTRDTKWVHVINADVEYDLEVSFDGGVNYITIGSGGDLQENLELSSLILRGNAAGTDYEVTAGLSAA